MRTIDDLSSAPKYSIKAVCTQTGIRPVTLRAWERRYGLLTPHRTDSNYRLYSEQDVALLRWLKGRVDSGISISTAAAELKELRRHGEWPEAPPMLHPPAAMQAPNPPSAYADRLFTALTKMDEPVAGDVLAEAHALFDLTTICLEVITPCLVRIGEGWHRGEILISTEHFASNYLRGRLLALMQAYPVRRGTACIIVGCAPSEQHDVGGLIFSILLRREGYRVDYVGGGVPLDDLLAFVRDERPALLCLSASSEDTARELCQVQAGLAAMRPAPRFGFGGRAFVVEPTLKTSVSGIFLGETAAEAVQAVRQLLP